MRLPGPPGPLRLLSTAGNSLLSSLRRHSAQLFVLSVGSASLALALQHSQWNVVAEVAQARFPACQHSICEHANHAYIRCSGAKFGNEDGGEGGG